VLSVFFAPSESLFLSFLIIYDSFIYSMPNSKDNTNVLVFLETVAAKAKTAAGIDAAEAKGKASEVAGQAKGKAAELKGEAKGKAEEIKGKL
jgi:hypothetical protein